MAKKIGEAEFRISIKPNQESLTAFQKELDSLKNLTEDKFRQMANNLNLTDSRQIEAEVQKMKGAVNQLNTVFQKSFSADLGTLNIAKFNEELKRIDTKTFREGMQNLGAQGLTTFRDLTTHALTTNVQLKQMDKWVGKLAQSFSNTVNWGLSSAAFNVLINATQKAWSYTKNLDESLNNIRIVTGQSADQMERFAQTANKAAANLGKSTKDYTDASLIYYQQGFKDQEVKARTDVTLKTANVTGQSTQTVSEQLTAVWNGYKVSASEAELYVDKLAAVAAATAADLEELSTGMGKVASAANLMGVDIDQLNAQLATIVSVTRQAPESVGTALKTIYARMGDIEAGIDTETTLGNYTKEMEAMGFNVLNANGKLRDMGDVIEEIGKKWTSLSREQQIALSQVMAGTRQYNNLLSLFDNWDMYSAALETSKNSMGTLQKQQDIYMESTAAHLEKLSSAFEKVIDNFMDNEGINEWINGLTMVVSLLGDFIQSLGGGANLLKGLSGIGLNFFSKPIAQAINTSLYNFGILKEEAGAAAREMEIIQSVKKLDLNDEGTNEIIKMKTAMSEYYSVMTEDQKAASNALIQATAELYRLRDSWIDNKEAAEQYIQTIANGESVDLFTIDQAKGKEILERLANKHKETANKVGSFQSYLTEGGRGWTAIKDLSAINPEVDKKASEKMERAKAAIKKDVDELYSYIKNSNELSQSSLEKFESAYVGFGVGLSTANKELIMKSLKDMEAGFTETGKSIRQKINLTSTTVQAALKSTESVFKQRSTEIKNVYNQLIEEFKTGVIVKQITQTIGAINMLASAFSALTNIKNIVNNDALTGWEKFLQILMAVSYTLPMLINGFTTLASNLGTSVTALSKVIDLITLWILKLKGENTETTKNTALKIAQHEVEKKNLKQLREQTNLRQRNIQLLKEETRSLLQQHFAKNMTEKLEKDLTKNQFPGQQTLAGPMAEALSAPVGKTVTNTLFKPNAQIKLKLGKTGTYKGVFTQVGKNSGLSAIKGSLKTLGASIVKFLSAAGPYLLALGAIAAAVYLLVKAYNKQADAHKNALEGLEDLKDSYQKANEQAQALKETISSYKDAVSGLENLKTSTEEYADALAKANEKARELIEAQGLFGKSDYDIKNGLITFEEDDLKELQKQADLKASQAERMMLLAQLKVYDTEKELREVNLERDKRFNTTYVNYAGNITTDNAVDRVEPFLEALRKQNRTYYETLMADTPEADALLEEFFKKNIKYQEGSDMDKYLIDPIIENKKVIDEYFKALDEITNATNYTASKIFESMITDQYGEEIEELAKDENGEVNAARQAQITAIYAKLDQQEKDKIQQLTEDKVNNLGERSDLKYHSNNKLNENFGYDIKNDEDLAYKYAIKTGLIKESERHLIQYESGTGVGTLKRADGTKILDAYSDEKMRYQLALLKIEEDIRAQNNLGPSPEQQVQNLKDSGAAAGLKYGTDFTDAFLNAVTSENNKLDLSSLYKDFTPSEVNDLMSKVSDALENGNTQPLLDALSLDASELQTMGFQTGEELAKAVEQGFTGYSWDRESAIQHEINKALEDPNTDGMTKKVLNDYAEELTNYTEVLMRTAQNIDPVTKKGNELADTLEEDAESAVLVAKGVIQMNKGIETLAENFENWSSIIKDSSESSQEYAEAVGGMAEALSEVYGISDDFIHIDFMTSAQNLDLIRKVAEGDEKAIDQLRNSLLDDISMRLVINNGGDQALVKQIQSTIDEIQNAIPDLDLQFGIGAKLNMDSFNQSQTNIIDKMNEIVEQADLTVEEANALFGAMGYDVEYVKEEVPVDQTVPEYVTETEIQQLYPLRTKTRTWQDGTYTAKGKVQMIGMTTDPNTGKAIETTPKIKGVTRKAPSSFNNRSSTNAGGVGKGGSSSKQDPIKKDLDRFHDIDIVLGDITHQLNMVGKAQEKAFGTDALKSYADELHLLDRQMQAISGPNGKLDIAHNWLADLRKTLDAQGVEFDPVTGAITNYMDIYKIKVDEVNKLKTKSTKGMTDAQKEAHEDALKNAEQIYEQFEKDFEKYEEILHSVIPSLREELADNLAQRIETQLESFNMEIELRLEIAEADRDWNKFRRKVIEGLEDDDILGRVYANLEDFSTYYNEAETGSIQAAVRHISDLRAELDELERTGLASGTYEDDKKQALEDLKKYREELEKQMEALYDMVQDTKKAYIDMLQEAEESFGRQLETYSQLSDIINHDMKIIDLVYGEDSYGPKSSYYNRLVNNDREQIDFQRQEVEFWAAQMSKAQREQNKEAYDEARKNWMAAVKEYNSSLEKSIENIKDKYLNAINLIFDELNDRVTNNKGLDYVGQEWDLVNKNADQYLDDINRAYGITDLEKKYRDALNGTDSLRVQEKIKKIMDEELKALREKDKLTEYDVERAERKYEIMLKQIALEEAQQNKSQLRLRRDSQGNYTYQYVADEDAIAKAEAELEKAKNDLYNFDKAEYQNNLNQLYDIWVEFQEEMAKAAQINDPVERAAREKLVEEEYGKLINAIVTENTVIRKNLQESAMDEVEAMKDEKLDKFVMEDVPYWTSGVQEMADVFVGKGGFLPVCKDKLEELDDATEEYERDLDDLEDVAEESFGMIKGGLDVTLIATQALIQENDALIDSYDATLAAIDREIKAMEELIRVWERYTQTKEVALDAYEYSQSEDVIAAQHAEWAKDLDMDKDYSAEMGKYKPGSEEYLKAAFLRDLKTQRDPTIDYGLATTDRVDMFYRLGKSLAAMGKGTFLDITEAEWKAIEKEFAALGSNVYANDWSPVAEWKTTQATPTGPTTKSSTTVGRSTNIMTNVADLLNDVSNRLDSQLFKKLADGANALGNAISSIFTSKSSTTNQNVHIDASFPNVQSSNEILNALKNVVNVASQIANR